LPPCLFVRDYGALYRADVDIAWRDAMLPHYYPSSLLKAMRRAVETAAPDIAHVEQRVLLMRYSSAPHMPRRHHRCFV